MLHKRRLVILFSVYNCDISTGVSCHCLVAVGNAVIKSEEWKTIRLLKGDNSQRKEGSDSNLIFPLR